MRNTRTFTFRSSDFDREMCSMNTSENCSDYLDYDYDSSCYQDSNSTISNGVKVRPVLYYILFCLGLPGNATVIWILLRSIKLKTMTDVCLLNLAMSDLILAASLPLWAYNSDNLTSCKLMTGIYQLGFYSGTFFVTLMSLDRYLAIVHAVAAMRARTLRYGIIASIITWVISVVMAIPQVTFASIEVMDEDNDSLKCQPTYPEEEQQFWKTLQNFSENTVSLFVCLPIMIFCYVKILVVLSKARNSKKNRAVRLIFTIVCAFVLCWVPYNVTVFLQTLQIFEYLNTCEDFQAIITTRFFAEIIAMSHCCVNPVIYAFVGEKFRKSLRNMLAGYFCLTHQSRGPFSHRDTTDKETSNTPVKSDY